MKKLIAIMLVTIMALAYAACGGKPQNSGNNNNNGSGQSGSVKETNAAVKVTKAPGSTVTLDGSMLGVLQKVAIDNSSKDKIDIKGLLITTDSGHHDYKPIEELITEGYKTEGIYDEFMLNEWFSVYADIEGGPVNVYIIPNNFKNEISLMKAVDLAAISEKLEYPIFAGAVTPDPDNHGFLLSAYVNKELGEGLYDIFFTSGEKILYVVQLKLVPDAE